MKIIKILIVLSLFITNTTLNNAQASKIDSESVAPKNGYKYIRTPDIYFINNSGYYSRATGNFSLVEDTNGYLHIAYTNNYGTSYHPVLKSNRRDFKYACYIYGWYYFN